MIELERDAANELASLIGISNPGDKDDSELQKALHERMASIMHAGQQSPFSMMVNGKDLRREIIQGIIDEEQGDPSMQADLVMVNLGFTSGYADEGDSGYTEGFVEYLRDVGLIQKEG